MRTPEPMLAAEPAVGGGAAAVDAPVRSGVPGDATGRLLEVRDLSVAYATAQGPVVAVDHVEFDLAAGEFLAVVGESGCGKSTLLYAVSGLLSSPAVVTGGHALFRGQDMATMNDKQLRHIRWRDFSVVMQSAMNALNPVMTVGDQMADALRAHSEMSKEEIAARSAEMMRLVSIDPVHLASYPHQLSGGMRQRSMIAMALLFTPQLVIMDEPTSALDVVAQRSLMRQIKQLQEGLGFAVIFITHDMSLVSHFSDRLMVMYAGQVAELGPTKHIFDDPLHPYSRGLLDAFPSIHGPRSALTGIPGHPPDLASPPVGCRFQPRCTRAVADCATTPPELLRRDGVLVRCLLYTPGAPVRLAATPKPAAADTPADTPAAAPAAAAAAAAAAAHASADDEAESAPPLLEVTGLTRHFRLGGFMGRRQLHAVDDVSFSIGRREILALVGESGSGKSTVARLLVLLYRPTSGEICFEGKPVSGLKSRSQLLEYRGHVPMVFQDPYSSINPTFRVSHGIARAMRLHRPDLSRAEQRREAIRVLSEVGLVPPEQMLEKFPYELSGGQRQRVGFAQALALKPKLIVADEPVSMLDVSIRIGVLNMMADLREAEGVSFLYITHDLASARYVADRVLVMYAGHLVESGPAEAVLSAPRHPYTSLLLRSAPDPKAPLDAVATTDAGEPPRVVDPSPGCRFRERCPFAVERCTQETPELRPLSPGHLAACHVAETLSL